MSCLGPLSAACLRSCPPSLLSSLQSSTWVEPEISWELFSCQEPDWQKVSVNGLILTLVVFHWWAVYTIIKNRLRTNQERDLKPRNGKPSLLLPGGPPQMQLLLLPPLGGCYSRHGGSGPRKTEQIFIFPLYSDAEIWQQSNPASLLEPASGHS